MSDGQVSFPSSDIPHPDDLVWLKTLLENSPHGIFALNESRRFIYVNPFVCELLGSSCEELLGTSLLPHVASESLEFVSECLEIRSNGEADPKHCECTLLCRQDERKIVQIAITPGHDIAGREVILGSLIDITEKKTAERRLDIFRQIVATSGNSITFMDRDHKYQIVNQAFLDLHQLEEKDVIGRCVGDLLGPDIYTKIKDHHQQCLSGQHLHMQDWFHFPNVGSKFLDVQYHPHREADGTVSGVVAIVADQTAQETNRQTLVRERQRLDDVLTGTRAGTWEWNVETGETLFNERWAEIIGYSLDELSPTTMKTWIQFVHPEDLQESNELLEKHFNGELDYYDFECRMRHKQGHWVWINDRGKVLSWSDEGRPLLMYGTHIDITARKEAEAMNVQFSRAIDQSFNEIYTFDCETLRFINVNAGARLNLGYSLTELRSMTPLDIKPEYTRENFTALVEPLRNGSQKKIIFTTHHRRKDGSCYPTEIQLQMIAGDNPVFLANVLDITEEIEQEAQRHELEAQLRQKHKMEAVGYMAGGMAHNFNNNLSIILGNLELTLMKQPPGSEVINFLENAKIAVRRSRDLVQSLMTYSRKGVQQKSATRLTTIIDETLHLIQVTIPSTVLLKKHYAAGCEARRIHADPSQIQEVLINLCNNAVQAMDEKGELTILLEPVTIRPRDIPVQYDCLPGRYAKLSVQDSGCGMDEETLEHIFDPFFSSKEAYEGAGMGLATVQGIVAQHGGMIKVSSRLNQGTTFDLYFPFVAETDGDERVPQDDELHGGHEQILYVDDDPVLIELGKELLGEMGYGVSVMNDGEDALKVFSADAERFDLVITDQTMPGLTGEELIHRIKAIRPDIPTILCTGYSSKMDEAKAKELGISAFMMKPVESSRLLQTIRKVLDERKAR